MQSLLLHVDWKWMSFHIVLEGSLSGACSWDCDGWTGGWNSPWGPLGCSQECEGLQWAGKVAVGKREGNLEILGN